MPSTTTKKRGNQLVITFKNANSELEINDVIHDEVFNLSQSEYSFILRPTSNAWRFGLRLYTSEQIPFSTTSRHIKEGNIDLQIAVGTWYKRENYWENPNRIELNQYNLDSLDHILDRFDEYKDKERVELSIGRDSADILNIVYKTGKHRVSKNLNIPAEYNYFKLFAWADKKEFDIDCTIKVKRKKSSGTGSNSERFWFLKLSPDSWNVSNLIEGAVTWFGSFQPKTGE
jgi:hypothetical protein